MVTMEAEGDHYIDKARGEQIMIFTRTWSIFFCLVCDIEPDPKHLFS